MFFYVLFAIINNIASTVIAARQEKANTKWLQKAQKAYDENLNTLFYSRSEIALRKKYHLYAAVSLRTVIGSWLITIIMPFFVDEKIFLIIYIGNYIYGRILYWLALIEQKIEVIKDEVYKENEYL